VAVSQGAVTNDGSWVSPLGDLGRDDVAEAGGKAANLGELVSAGVPVPPGFVVTTAAYLAYVAANDLQDRVIAAVPAADAETEAYEAAARQIAGLFAAGAVPDELAAEIADGYRALSGGSGPAVAVRSSATAEDLEGASFAGQQDTYLNIRGVDAVLDAVRRCWASLWTARAMAYRARQGIDPAEVSLAVVVQELVDAAAAGVMFTADPSTGRRDTVLISAAWGLGEAVVGGLVNTDQLTLTGDGLTVTDRQTADKAVQTVRTEDGTTEVEVPQDRRRAPVLDDSAAHDLAALGRRIAQHFGAPQDIEWARSTTGELLVVQSRPITALPAPTGPVPIDWEVPDDGWYFRASIVEQLPDPLTPLFAELIEPAVVSSITAIMSEVLGEGSVRPGDVGFPTVNGYAYYAYGRAGMKRMLRASPRAMWAAFGPHGLNPRLRWERDSRPHYQQLVDAWTTRELEGLSPTELLDGIAGLVEAGAVYYTAVQTIIPLAATSEIALTRYYDAFIRRDGDPPASALLLGFDSEPIRAERSLWDLAHWAGEDSDLAGWLIGTEAADIVSVLDLAGPFETDGGRSIEAGSFVPSSAAEFAARFRQHLDAYGHAVYNLDVANPVAADDPAPLVDTVRLYLTGQAGDPYERQRRLQQKRDAATVVIRRRIDPVRRGQFDWLLRKAQAIAPIREDALADVGLAWPQLRRMLAELGGRLVETGAVDRRDDVFWCRRTEIEAALATDSTGSTGAGLPGAGLRDLVEQRRQTWRGQRRATPPQLLPQGTWMDSMGSMMPATMAEQTGDVLSGIGASSGRVTGTARVLDGPADFARLQPGEVLVASITTPAWTSLFARAAAVVTDIGGPLSHSSIVAREYGIPAVLGTAVATRRVVDGQQITVDGDAGKVYLAEVGAASAQPGHRRLNRWLIAGGVAAAGVGAVTATVVRSRRRA
jgi:phosphohistidine swiveling domain-containing protein